MLWFYTANKKMKLTLIIRLGNGGYGGRMGTADDVTWIDFCRKDLSISES